MSDVHSCSYHCDRPACVKVQRDALRDKCTRLRAEVDKQAEDAGLWFVAQTASEAYLQEALRALAAEVEKA